MIIRALRSTTLGDISIVGWYERHLLAGINYARWLEYSLSASVMVILIAMLTGITNLYAVIGLFGVNAAMIAFGALMERMNQGRDRVTWLPFVFGSVAGAVPWVAITIAIVAAANESDGVPGFVYGIFVSAVQLFRSQPDPAIQTTRAFRGLPLWREGLHRPESHRQVSIGLAGVRRHSRRLSRRISGAPRDTERVCPVSNGGHQRTVLGRRDQDRTLKCGAGGDRTVEMHPQDRRPSMRRRPVPNR